MLCCVLLLLIAFAIRVGIRLVRFRSWLNASGKVNNEKLLSNICGMFVPSFYENVKTQRYSLQLCHKTSLKTATYHTISFVKCFDTRRMLSHANLVSLLVSVVCQCQSKSWQIRGAELGLMLSMFSAVPDLKPLQGKWRRHEEDVRQIFTGGEIHGRLD